MTTGPLYVLQQHSSFSFFSKDVWTIRYECKNPDGTPFDLTGAALEWKLKSDNAAGAAITLTTGFSFEDTDGVSGVVIVRVASDMTKDLAQGVYKDQLRATIADDTFTLWSGPIEVLTPL